MLTPSEVLEAFQVPARPRWFTIGYGESRVTLYTQQVRALNLAWALAETGTDENSHVVVVGGGAAGLAVAAGLAKRKVKVTLLEKARHLLPLQRNCHKRHLHPHVFDWPESIAENTRADLPVLDWGAATAYEVARQIEDGFLELQREVGEERLVACVNVENVELDSPSEGQVTYWVRGTGRGRHAERYTHLVFALGFGVENSFWIGRRGSYWADDSLEQHGVMPSGKYLVSGGGDGAMIDTFRLLLPEVTQHGLVRMLRARNEHEREFVEWIRETDVRAQAAGASQRAAGDMNGARAEEGASLWESYHRFDEGRFGLSLDSELRTRLNDSVLVTVVTRDASPFTLRARPLHRFIFSRLYFQFGDHLAVQCGRQITSADLRQEGQHVVLVGDVEERFEHVIVRHGSNPKESYAAFPALAAALEGWIPRSIGHEARWYPSKYFGSPATAFRGVGGPDEDDYLDALWGRGYLTETDRGRVPLSEFSDIAVELSAVDAEPLPAQASGRDTRAREEQRPGDGEQPTTRHHDEPAEEVDKRSREERDDFKHVRDRWKNVVIGVSLIPCESEARFRVPTFIKGYAGAGKSTLVQHLVHESIRAWTSDRESQSFPILVRFQPDLRESTVHEALAAAALRSAEIPNLSRAHNQILRRLEKQKVRVYLDTAENWDADAFRSTVEMLFDHGHEVVGVGRQFPVAPEELRIGAEVKQYRIVGLAPASRRAFLSRQLGDAGLESEPLTLASPMKRVARFTPFLLLEIERARKDLGKDPESVLSVFETRMQRLLPNTDERVEVARLARRLLCSVPPRFDFSERKLGASVRKRIRESGLLTGSRVLEFRHLTYAEYLAAGSLSRQDLTLAREELRKDGRTWHHQLEVLAMAHAMHADALENALDELRVGGDADHRQLALIFRSLTYLGPAASAFASRRGQEVMQRVRDALVLSSGRFGDIERALLQEVVAVTPALKLDATGWSELRGDPEAARWAIVRSLRAVEAVGLPPESFWWDTVLAEARALVASGETIERVLDATRGARDWDEQHAAISALRQRRGHFSLLTSSEFLVWNRAVADAGSFGNLPHYLALLCHGNGHARTSSLHLVSQEVVAAAGFRPVLEALLRKDPDPEVQASAVSRLGEVQESSLREFLLQRFRALLEQRKTISTAEHWLFTALLRMFHDEPGVLQDLERFVRGGAHWFVHGAEEFRLLFESRVLRDVLRERLQGSNVLHDDVRAAAHFEDLHSAVRALLMASLDTGDATLVAVCVRTLPSGDPLRVDTSRRILGLPGGRPLGDVDMKPARWAAVEALAGESDAATLLESVLASADDHEAVGAALFTKAFQATPLGADLAERVARQHWDDVFGDWHNCIVSAVDTLAQHQNKRPVLRHLLDRPVKDPGAHPWDHRRANVFKALVDEMAWDEVSAYLDDPSPYVRLAAVARLREETSSPQLSELLKRRALTEPKADVQKLLWEICKDDAQVRALLVRKARMDSFALRRAFLVEVSDDENRVSELRAAAELAIERHPQSLRDFVEPLARDPEARQLLVRFLDEGPDVAELVLHVLEGDPEIAKAVRSRCGSKDWVRRFGMFSSALVEFLRDDDAARAKIWADLNDGSLAFPVWDAVRILGTYPPAREWVLEKAILSDDANVQREARADSCDHERVRPLIEADLALPPTSTVRRHRIAAAVACAKDSRWAWPAIVGMSESSDRSTRKAAFLAAIRLGKRPAVLVASDGELETDLQSREVEPALRKDILRYLRHAGLSEAEQRAIRRATAVGDFDPDVRRAARAGLLPAEPAEALREQLKSIDPVRPDASQVGQATAGYESNLAWVKLKLVSTLPDEADWAAAETHADVEGAFGEVLKGTAEVAIPAGVTLLRLAKDSSELPRDRMIYPAANVVLAWFAAQQLVAHEPTVVMVACADLHSTELVPMIPELQPGEVHLGPVLFGFRLREMPSPVHTEAEDDAKGPD